MNNVYAAVMTALIVAVLYVGLCAVSPYVRCPGCIGKRQPSRPDECMECAGGGLRGRVGFRAYRRVVVRARRAASR